MQRSNCSISILSKISRKSRESPCSTSCRVSLEDGASLSLDLAIEAYRGLISTPTPLRPSALAERRVLHVPKKGTSNHMFHLDKNTLISLNNNAAKQA